MSICLTILKCGEDRSSNCLANWPDMPNFDDLSYSLLSEHILALSTPE